MRTLLIAFVVMVIAIGLAPAANADELTRGDIITAWDTARAGDSNLASLWDPMPMDWTVTWLDNTTLQDMYNGSDYWTDVDTFITAVGDAIPNAIVYIDPEIIWDLGAFTDPENWQP